jgi:hypothetical protein
LWIGLLFVRADFKTDPLTGWVDMGRVPHPVSRRDPPEVNEAEHAMLAVAAGEVDEPWLAGWLRERVCF